MPLVPGTRLGAYEIVAPIGAGGMGEVYRARDARLGRDVAIKCLPDAFAADPDRLMRFEREARTLASVNHPHIAQVYGLEEWAGTRALVMELVEGEDLSERIARGAMPLDEALPIARQIVAALEAAHALGIIHRDLKPANIKVRPDGEVKVLDFGLAKALAPDANGSQDAGSAPSPTITTPAMTLRGVILGTAAYMAPEQAKGKLVDKRADIWAFGCVLYEMLTGRRAFEGEDVSDTLAAILRADPDWSALPPIPPALTLLLKRCLDRDWRRRVADVSAIRFVLDDVVGLTPSAAAAPPADSVDVELRVSAAVARARRQMRLRTVVPLLAFLLIAAVVAAFAFARVLQRDLPLPVTRFVLPLPQGQVLTMSRRMTTLSPDGQVLGYLTDNQFYLRRFAQFEAEAIAGADLGQQITSPAFSPDGAWLAFHSGSQNAIKRVSVRGGGALRVCDAPIPSTLTWDDRGILLGMGAGGILRCDPTGGAAVQLVRAQDGELIISPQLLTDDIVLFTSARASEPLGTRWDKAEVVTQSLKTGTRRVVVQSGSDARYVTSGHLVYRYAGILYALPFNPDTQEVRGEAVSVIEGITRASAGPTQMSLSQSGTLVYMPGVAGTSSVERQLMIGDRAGVTSRGTLPSGPFVHVRVSTDGSQLALGSDDGKDANVWVYALDGRSALRRLTLTGRNRSPVWSPDGHWLAFQSERGEDRGIYRQRADGTGGPERLTTAAPGETHIPESWSPDGRYLAYAVQAGPTRPGYALWMLSMADRKAAAFGGVTSSEPIGATFSPDGRWIAYSHAGGDDISAADRGVFVQPFPATGTVYQAPRQLVDFHPLWSRDGRELMFLASTTARQMAVMQVTVNGDGLTFTAPTRFPASVTGDKLSGEPRVFDILPDGRLIGLVGRLDITGAGFAELRVVMNWLEELAQRVPAK